MYILNKSDVIKSLSPIHEKGKVKPSQILMIALMLFVFFLPKEDTITTYLNIILYTCMMITSFLFKSISEIHTKFKDEEYDSIMYFKKSKLSKVFKSVWITFNIVSAVSFLLSITSLLIIDFKDEVDYFGYIYPFIMIVFVSLIYCIGHDKYKNIMI